MIHIDIRYARQGSIIEKDYAYVIEVSTDGSPFVPLMFQKWVDGETDAYALDQALTLVKAMTTAYKYAGIAYRVSALGEARTEF